MTIKTRVYWRRELSPTELAARQSKMDELVAAGVTDGALHEDPDRIGFGEAFRTWTTIEAANEWIAFVNTFTPPPTTAVTESV